MDAKEAPGPPSDDAPAGPAGGPSCGDEEERLRRDPRFAASLASFNEGAWYACHDGFEELWHETQGPMRPVLQGVLQLAVAELHLERGNVHGATVLMGEGLGRLRRCGPQALGLELEPLRQAAAERLLALQRGEDVAALPLPRLRESGGGDR